MIPLASFVDEAVWHVVEAALAALGVLVVPKSATVALALAIGFVLDLTRRVLVVGPLQSGLAAIVGMLVVKLVGVSNVVNGTGVLVMIGVVSVVVCCSIDVVRRPPVSSCALLSPPAVVAFGTQGDTGGNALPKGVGGVCLPAFGSSEA